MRTTLPILAMLTLFVPINAQAASRGVEAAKPERTGILETAREIRSSWSAVWSLHQSNRLEARINSKLGELKAYGVTVKSIQESDIASARAQADGLSSPERQKASALIDHVVSDGQKLMDAQAHILGFVAR